MLNTLTLITILFYVSLFVELFFYDIPSVVATRKILRPNTDDFNYFSDNIKAVLNWSYSKKFIVFVLPMVFIYLLHVLPAYFIYDLYFNDSHLSSTTSAFYIGIVLVVLGRIVSHLYLLSIQKIKSKSFDGFVVSGLFKFSRNPGLLGLYISFLGFLIIHPSVVFMICFIIYIVHMHFKIRMEEDYLVNKNQEDYKTYLQKTKRYL